MSGVLAGETRWCGRVEVAGSVRVPPGSRLVVEPGTVVRMRAYRGHAEPERRVVLRVEGQLLARGRPDAPVRFTSDHADPRNGDWGGIEASGAKAHLEHTIVEFATYGVQARAGTTELVKSTVRFNNWDGLRLTEGGRASVDGSRVYGNGHNCVTGAGELTLAVTGSYVGHCGVLGLAFEGASGRVERCLLEGSSEGVYLSGGARVLVDDNRFVGQQNAAISCESQAEKLELGENVLDGMAPEGAVVCPEPRPAQAVDRSTMLVATGAGEGAGPYLGYVPGDRSRDPFPYLYPDADETRRVTRPLGADLGQIWSVAASGPSLWVATSEGKILKLEAASGRVLARFSAPGGRAAGMALGRDRLWVCDPPTHTIYGLAPASGRVLGRVPFPEGEVLKGVAHDGERLWALGFTRPALFRLSPSGAVEERVDLEGRDLGAGIKDYPSGSLAWDGEAFWGAGLQIYRFGKDGKLRGWIHRTGERMWGLAFEERTLWTVVGIHEDWKDVPALRGVEVLKLLGPRGAGG